MPIRFASEAWPRPGLAEPRSASIAGCGNTGPLSATEQKGKECHNQDKQAQGASFGGSFLVPEIDLIFGDGVGASLVVETWRPERDLDCTRNKVGRRERKSMY